MYRGNYGLGVLILFCSLLFASCCVLCLFYIIYQDAAQSPPHRKKPSRLLRSGSFRAKKASPPLNRHRRRRPATRRPAIRLLFVRDIAGSSPSLHLTWFHVLLLPLIFVYLFVRDNTRLEAGFKLVGASHRSGLCAPCACAALHSVQTHTVVAWWEDVCYSVLAPSMMVSYPAQYLRSFDGS